MFENARTLDRELEIIKAVCEKWKCGYHKLPLKVCLDFVLERDGAFKAVTEVRDRSYSYEWLSANGGYMVSVFKVERGFAYCALLRVPFILVVRCSGGDIWHVELRPTKPRRPVDPAQRSLFGPQPGLYAVSWPSEWRLAWFDGNRTFRREDDREPVFMIPMSVFGRL